jgi:catechol 2,3-dioxygenase-like lactoylglutathione lyase family enzyme
MKNDKVKYQGSNVTLMVASMAKSVKFYTETIGLELKVRHSSHWAEVTAPGITIGLHPKMKNKNIKKGDSITIGLEVNDIEQAMEHLASKGIEFDIHKDSQVYQAYFNDPDDNVLYLFQYRKKKNEE